MRINWFTREWTWYRSMTKINEDQVLELLQLDTEDRKELAIVLIFSLLDDLSTAQVLEIAEILDRK